MREKEKEGGERRHAALGGLLAVALSRLEKSTVSLCYFSFFFWLGSAWVRGNEMMR